MHVTTKDIVGDKDAAKELGVEIGTHILTSTIEGDGAVALASTEAKFDARVISVYRTDSGGIQVQTAVTVTEPAPVAAPAPEPAALPEPTPAEQATAYFLSKGYSETDAAANVAKFGVARVLAMRDKELDEELAKALAPKEVAPTPITVQPPANTPVPAEPETAEPEPQA